MVDGYYEVLWRHQIVLECIPCESETQTGLCLENGDQREVERERESTTGVESLGEHGHFTRIETSLIEDQPTNSLMEPLFSQDPLEDQDDS